MLHRTLETEAREATPHLGDGSSGDPAAYLSKVLEPRKAQRAGVVAGRLALEPAFVGAAHLLQDTLSQQQRIKGGVDKLRKKHKVCGCVVVAVALCSWGGH